LLLKIRDVSRHPDTVAAVKIYYICHRLWHISASAIIVPEFSRLMLPQDFFESNRIIAVILLTGQLAFFQGSRKIEDFWGKRSISPQSKVALTKATKHKGLDATKMETEIKKVPESAVNTIFSTTICRTQEANYRLMRIWT